MIPIDIIIVNAIMLGIGGLAIWKGGPAERQGAILYCVFWLGATLVTALTLTTSTFNMYTILVADWAVAFGFLFLAIRHSNLWLATAMIAQGLSSAAHAYRLEDELMSQAALHFWRSAINLLSVIVLLSLLFGTLFSWRRRATQGRKPLESIWSAPSEAPERA